LSSPLSQVAWTPPQRSKELREVKSSAKIIEETITPNKNTPNNANKYFFIFFITFFKNKNLISNLVIYFHLSINLTNQNRF
jgi:hypothetical protein